MARRPITTLVGSHDAENAACQADRVLGWLRQMDGDSPYQISRLDHCLQTATRAENDGADDETIACALLHDIGDILAPDESLPGRGGIARAVYEREESLDRQASWPFPGLLLV